MGHDGKRHDAVNLSGMLIDSISGDARGLFFVYFSL